MGLPTRYSSHFNAAGLPLLNRPFTTGMGLQGDSVTLTIPVGAVLTEFDALLAIPSGKTLWMLIGDYPDLENGGPTYNGDVKLRSMTAAGVSTDTLVYDTSADSVAFTSAVRGRITYPNIVVPASTYGFCYLGLYHIASATTPVAGDLSLTAFWR